MDTRVISTVFFESTTILLFFFYLSHLIHGFPLIPYFIRIFVVSVLKMNKY